MSQQPQLLALHSPAVDPPSGRKYPLALTHEAATPFQWVFGLLLGFSAFAVAVPLFSQAVLGVGFLLRGGGDWATYQEQARGYLLPDGPVSGHLALALLIPISVLLVRYVHGVHPRWLASVQPGIRWRYLLIAFVAALVTLNGVLWLSNWASGELPTFNDGQAGWVWFAVLILITSPLQAAAEEVFFRGYLMQAIGSGTGRVWVGVVGSAFVFALLHGSQNVALFLHRFAFGLVAGALVVLTGGLEAGIAAHVVNNLAAYGYAMFTTSVAQLRGVTSISWQNAVWDIAGFALFAVVAWLLGKKLRLAVQTP